MSALAAELDGIDLGDQRLNRRARRVLATRGDKLTVSIPAACGGWSETPRNYTHHLYPGIPILIVG
jgi:hypothetical protein